MYNLSISLGTVQIKGLGDCLHERMLRQQHGEYRPAMTLAFMCGAFTGYWPMETSWHSDP